MRLYRSLCWLLLVFSLSLTRAASAQTPLIISETPLSSWDWVVPKIDAVYLDDDGKPVQPQQFTSVFQSERVNGKLWSGEAWLEPSMVLRVNEALIQYTKLLKEPSSQKAEVQKAEVYRLRAEVYRHRGELLFALFDYNQALKLEPNSFKALAGRGTVYLQQGSLDLAQQDLAAAVRLQPKNLALQIALGNIISDTGDSNQAMKVYQAALALNPKSAITLSCIGKELAKQGKHEDAIERFDQSLAIKRDPDVSLERIETLLAQKKTNEAQAELTEFVKSNPRHARAWTLLGTIQAKSNKFKDAGYSFNEATSHDDQNPVVWHNRGMLRFQSGYYEKAMEDFEQALKCDQNYLPSLIAATRVFAASTNKELLKTDLAIALGLHALDVGRHQSALAYATLATVYAARGAFDDAVRCQEKAIALAQSQKTSGLDVAKLEIDLQRFRQSKTARTDPVYFYER